MVEIKAPGFPESVEEGTLLSWHVEDGSFVERDAKLADVETDKVVLEVFALEAGTIAFTRQEGDILQRDEVLARIDASGNGAGAPKAAKAEAPPKEEAKKPEVPVAAGKPAAASVDPDTLLGLSPSLRKMIIENDVPVDTLAGSGGGGRITQADVLAYLNKGSQAPTQSAAPPKASAKPPMQIDEAVQRRVPMSQIRARIAQRLLEVQQTAAILTTFNEVNMQPVMDLRGKYKERFEQQYGVKLGLMSFFVKAAVEALKKFPAINAFLDGRDIIYNEEFHVGIAVDSPRGLLVPVLRNVEHMKLADIEKTIRDYAVRAKEAKIQYEELVGGTFTITNGGVFGSMLSTPILNAPQSGILGMHSITDRPIAENGEVVVRPVMYLALSYDHRIVDGRDAVQFLVSIKQALEDPAQMLLQI